MRIVASLDVLRALTAMVLPRSSAADLIESLAQNWFWFQPELGLDGRGGDRLRPERADLDFLGRESGQGRPAAGHEDRLDRVALAVVLVELFRRERQRRHVLPRGRTVLQPQLHRLGVAA
jgi:hypothetical protein